MDRDSGGHMVTLSSLVGAGTVIFGFIWPCETYAPPTAEYLQNAWRPMLQSLQWHYGDLCHSRLVFLMTEQLSL